MTPASAAVNPAYSLQIRIPARAVPSVLDVVASAPGTVACPADEPDVTGARLLTLDTDSADTLAWLREQLVRRLGADLLDASDPVFLAAATGKLGQRVCAAVTTGHDVALLDTDADRRVVRHLAGHPADVDRYTGRARRVALLSDASAVLGLDPLTAETALPAVESQAVHLRRATGLDVFPLPVAAADAADLASAARLIAPGFAASVLVYTRPGHVAAVRAILGADPSFVLLDSVNDGLAVAATAAALTVLRRRGTHPALARVAVVDPGRGGDLTGLLMAAGIADLTLYDHAAYGTGPLRGLAGELDLVVDLAGIPGLAALAPDVPVIRARPDTPPPLASTTTGPRPLHALPGLLTAAVRARRGITEAARLAAVRALTHLTGGPATDPTGTGHILPPVDDPRVTPAVTAAALAALAPSDGPR